MKTILTVGIMTALLIGLSMDVCAQPLDTLLQKAVENNPQLKAIQKRFESIQAREDQMNPIADLEVGVGVPAMRPETRLGPQLAMVSAKQMFPWFGTTQAKKDVVISLAKAEYEKIAAEKLNLFHLIKTAYYQLVFIEEEQAIIRENIMLFQSIERTALAKVESGNATTADVLRVQTKIQALQSEIQRLDNQKLKFYAEINRAINQDWEQEIMVQDSVEDLPKIVFNLSEYEEKISNNHPLINTLEEKIQASKNEQLVNKKSGSPKIGFGLDYSLVGKRQDADPLGNGRDILTPKVMVKIPIYRKKYKSKNLEEELEQEALALEQETLTDRLVSRLIQYKADYENAVLDKKLYEKQYQTTKRAYDVLLAEYSSSGKGFFDLLEVQSQLLNFDLSVKKAKRDANIAVSGIERITNF